MNAGFASDAELGLTAPYREAWRGPPCNLRVFWLFMCGPYNPKYRYFPPASHTVKNPHPGPDGNRPLRGYRTKRNKRWNAIEEVQGICW